MDINFLEDIEKRLAELVNVMEQIDVRGQKSVWAAYAAFGLANAIRSDIKEKAEIEKLNNEKPSKDIKHKE